jgi:hypothetical protein
MNDTPPNAVVVVYRTHRLSDGHPFYFFLGRNSQEVCLFLSLGTDLNGHPSSHSPSSLLCHRLVSFFIK